MHNRIPPDDRQPDTRSESHCCSQTKNDDHENDSKEPRPPYSQELRRQMRPEHDNNNNNNKRRLMVPFLEATAAMKMFHVMRSDEESWKSRVLRFLHTKRVQYTLAGLLLLDVLILFIELALEAFSPTCFHVEKNGISCCPLSNIAEKELDSDSLTCQKGLPFLEYPITCDPEKRFRVEIVETVLFYFTVSILGVFLIELTTLIVILGPRHFFSHLLHTLDYVVVSVSFALEITFRVKSEAILEAITGLLIFGRFWRFLRIGHGIFETAKEVIQDRVEHVFQYTEELEQLLQQHGIPLPEHDIKERGFVTESHHVASQRAT